MRCAEYGVESQWNVLHLFIKNMVCLHYIIWDAKKRKEEKKRYIAELENMGYIHFSYSQMYVNFFLVLYTQ